MNGSSLRIGRACLALAALLVQPAPVPAANPGREVKAERIQGTILLDGSLDEPDWIRALPAGGFVQRFPAEGAGASQGTEVRVLYDDERLIIGARLMDSAPASLVAREMKEDSELFNDDSFAVFLDTFNDERNGYFFETNPLGARADALIFDEGRNNSFDWDGVWEVATRVTDEGWSVEMEIPFRTLRFDPEGDGSWGIQFRRIIRRNAEDVWWAPVPRNEDAWRISRAGTLSGLDGIRQGGKLEITPYALGSASRQPTLEEETTTGTGDVGLDARYSVTPNLAAVVTVNTDFAETEVDNQQVNTTRFPLFFPEKRDFFLESKGFFDFGFEPPGPGGPGNVVPFFSRRIGLGTRVVPDPRTPGATEEVQVPIPIIAGAKLTGRLGRYNLGVLSVETDEEGPDNPRTNYSALRLSRDFLTRSNWGIIGISKEPEGPNDPVDPTDLSLGNHSNRTYGADLNFSVKDNMKFGGSFLRTETPEIESGQSQGRVYLDWGNNVWEFDAAHTDIGESFNPEVGFVRRTGIEESRGRLAWAWRSDEKPIRKIQPHTSFTYIADQDHRMATRNQHYGVNVTFRSGSEFEVAWDPGFDRLDETFELADETHIPAGAYSMEQWFFRWHSDASRLISVSIFSEFGDFFDGNYLSASGSIAARFSRHLRSVLTVDRVEIELPERDALAAQGAALSDPDPFRTTLLQAEVGIAFTTRLFADVLVQHNTDVEDLSTNLRLNYKYRPGSDIYVVYTERRDIEGMPTDIVDKVFSVKWTYLFSL